MTKEFSNAQMTESHGVWSFVLRHFFVTRTLAFVICAAFALTGCASYKLGPTNGVTAGEHSIQINPFKNQTIEPRLSEYTTSSLRKELQQDGTYTLDTQDNGDIVVNGVITGFRRSQLTFQPSDVRTVRDYNLSMTAQITATERSTGKTILKKSVSGRTTIRVGSDLGSAERQAIPLLAEDLARNATSALVDGTW